MGQPVEVVVSELHSASARLDDAAQRLQDGLSGVNDEVTQLLGAGWKGGAASAYAPAWTQWHDGAKKVVEGLQRMSELLDISGKEYAKTDEQAAGALGSSMQGSGGSGGSGTGGSPATTSPGVGGDSHELAQRMESSLQSSPGSGLGEAVQPVAQAGQSVAGLAQTVAQLATGLAQQAGSGNENLAAGDEQDDPRKHHEDSEQAEDEAEAGGVAGSGERAPVETEQRSAPEIQRTVERPAE